MKVVVSRAHDVREELPVKMGSFVCLKCDLRGTREDMFGDKRCHPTLYRSGSGWRDESTHKEREELAQLGYEVVSE